MKSVLRSLTLALCLFACTTLRAADPATPEQLEATFKATMTSATMAGQTIALKDGALGESHDDKYSIVGVEKVGEGNWIINARFRDVVVPIPIKVKWAGDAAVIIVDDLRMPGPAGYGGAGYTARVMIHEHTYAGTWSGGDHGGLLTGVITNSAKP